MIRDLDGQAAHRPAVRTSAQTMRHARLAVVTAMLAAPKRCRGCGASIPARDCINVSRSMLPRWMCRHCAVEEEQR